MLKDGRGKTASSPSSSPTPNRCLRRLVGEGGGEVAPRLLRRRSTLAPSLLRVVGILEVAEVGEAGEGRLWGSRRRQSGSLPFLSPKSASPISICKPQHLPAFNLSPLSLVSASFNIQPCSSGGGKGDMGRDRSGREIGRR